MVPIVNQAWLHFETSRGNLGRASSPMGALASGRMAAQRSGDWVLRSASVTIVVRYIGPTVPGWKGSTGGLLVSVGIRNSARLSGCLHRLTPLGEGRRLINATVGGYGFRRGVASI